MKWTARVVGACGAAVLTLATTPAGAVNVLEDKEKGLSLDVAVLVQPQLQMTKDASPTGGLSTDLFVRRTRLFVFGKVTKEISFFLDTDQPNWGKNGDFASSMYIQDAVISWSPARELTIDGGMLLVPFSHHGLEGAAGLHGLDYHTALLPYATGIGKVLRDTGIVFRGLLFEDRIHYRLGAFEGVRGAAPKTATDPAPLNPNGEPRVTGELRVNILGSEDRLFLGGIYFAEKPLLSIGAGVDWQYKAMRALDGIAREDYLAANGDFFLEYPFSADMELVAKGQFTHSQFGVGNAKTGDGFFAEAGFRYTWIEPVVAAEWFKQKDFRSLAGVDTKGTQTTTVLGGLNFWARKHQTNLKAQLGWSTVETAAKTTHPLAFTLQGQVFF
jgi:hypothetical protein